MKLLFVWGWIVVTGCSRDKPNNVHPQLTPPEAKLLLANSERFTADARVSEAGHEQA